MDFIYQQFETQVAQTPEATALKFGTETLTYAQLNRRANQLAHYLRSKGIGAESMVGIVLERSLEMVIGLYGIMKAGGAYVPIDPEYPQERLAFMLADSQVDVLLTQAHLVDTLPVQADTTLLSLDADWPTISAYSDENPTPLIAPDNLAYVIYTSGSTGKPKGAMNTHRAIHNRLHWMQDEYQLTAADVVFQKTPFSFDVSVWEFFWPLMFGAQLIIAKPNGHKDAAYLIETIIKENVSVMHFVPSMLSLFLTDRDVAKCSSLRDVICSGEALSISLQTRFFAQLNANLHNLYGPTEAAIDVSYWQCDPKSTLHTVPIGFPVANTQLYILDDTMQPVPKGEEGELYLGGVQLARGYWNREELTSERFIDVVSEEWEVESEEKSLISNPQSPIPNPLRLYKTGDLARMLPDDSIEFLGRADFQVKLRGFRIELGEIEAALNSHRAVRESVILMREDTPDDKRLVAYIVFEEAQSATNLVLKTHLAQSLPDYMIPPVLMPLPEIPLTPNGKRDRRALPVPSQKRPDLEQAYSAPRTDLEQYLATIWQDVLQLEKVGVKDRFFELGGSSLQAAQFVNRVKEELGEFIYVVTIFESPTIETYAAMLQRDYANAVATKFGGAGDVAAVVAPQKVLETVTPATLAKLRRLVPVANHKLPVAAKNPSAIFILAPPRSGTTLLRVMLAGSPELFSAAELLLLGFDTLAERRDAFSGKFSVWHEGVIRALMEAHGVDADAAKEMLAGYEAQGTTTQALFAELQSAVSPRTLVDKSPAYALDIAAMNRAEHLFENARYIHLVRHPQSMVASFEKNHLAQTLYLKEHDLADRTLGELVWTASHQNILAFLKHIPAARQSRVHFEAMVQQPDATIEQLCQELALTYYPEMARPYENTAHKMTDGIYKESTPMGDTNFLSYKQINPETAERWRDLSADTLGKITWQIAEQLGYKSADNAPSTSPTSTNSRATNRQRPLRQSRRTKTK